MRPLTEQVILITGATDGLGKAVALQLAHAGATLLNGTTPRYLLAQSRLSGGAVSAIVCSQKKSEAVFTVCSICDEKQDLC